MRLLLAFAILCASLLPSAAQSPPMQTAVSTDSKSAKIRTEIDQRIRTDNRLYEFIVADAKRMAVQRHADAEKEWRTDKIMFQHGPWEFERGYYFNAEAGPYVSVSVLDYSYTGGAHPNHRTTVILWNRESGKRADIGALFRDRKPGSAAMRELAALIREEVAKEKIERDMHVTRPLEKDEWLSAIKADLSTMGAASLVPSTAAGKAAGIDFHFSPYDAGPYVQGAFGAYLSAQQLAPFLTDEARTFFGGERADQDTKEK